MVVFNDLLHDQVAEVDTSVVRNGKSNDLNHFGYSMESTDVRSKDMTDYGEEKIPFLRQMILINDPWNHVILIQGTLYPGEESQKILVSRIISKIFRWKVKGSV